MNKKAEVYKKFLEENKINWGDVFEVPKADEVPEESFMHPVVYRSAIGIQGQNLPTMLVIDDSIYVMLQVRVGAGLVKEANKAAVLAHLNALNENYDSIESGFVIKWRDFVVKFLFYSIVSPFFII